MNRRTKKIIWIVVAVVAIIAMGFFISSLFNSSEEISFNELLLKFENLPATAEAQIYIDGYTWEARFIDGNKLYAYNGTMPSVYSFNDYGAFLAELGSRNSAVFNGESFVIDMADPNAGSIWSSLLPIFGIVLIGVLFFALMRGATSGAGNAMSMNKSKTNVQANVRTRF